jgi:hypothetical protein
MLVPEWGVCRSALPALTNSPIGRQTVAHLGRFVQAMLHIGNCDGPNHQQGRRLTMLFTQTPAAAIEFVSRVYETIDSMGEQGLANRDLHAQGWFDTDDSGRDDLEVAGHVDR